MAEFAATFHFVEVESQNDVSRRAANKENAARPAVVEYIHQSTGVGQHRVKAALVFPVTFKTEPHFSFGSTVVNNPNHKIWHDPRGSSGIYAWQRDSRGYFTGALFWVHVAMDKIDPGGAYDGATAYTNANAYLKANNQAIVEHHLSFSALAFKDLPTKTLDPKLKPRSTGVG